MGLSAPDEIKIDVAFPGHAWAISRLVNSVYRGENSKKGWTTEAYLLGGIRIDVNRILQWTGKKNNEVLIASIKGDLVGCVHLEKFNSKCHLGMLSVDVNYQNKGIGKLIMNKSEIYAKEVFGCSEMEMKVLGHRKELINFYKRQGYKVKGVHEDFVFNKHFGVPLKKDLYFEFLVKPLD